MSEGFDWAALLEKAKAASFDPVPVDKYHVSVCETEATSASTGKPMIKLRLNIEDGPHKNRKLITQLVLSVENETALAIFFNHLKAFGIGPEFLAKCPPGNIAPVAQALMSKHAIANVGLKEWQGQTRNEVKGFAPLSGGMPTSSAPAGLPGLPSGSPGPALHIVPSVAASVPAASTGLPGLPNSSDHFSLDETNETPF